MMLFSKMVAEIDLGFLYGIGFFPSGETGFFLFEIEKFQAGLIVQLYRNSLKIEKN